MGLAPWNTQDKRDQTNHPDVKTWYVSCDMGLHFNTIPVLYAGGMRREFALCPSSKLRSFYFVLVKSWLGHSVLDLLEKTKGHCRALFVEYVLRQVSVVTFFGQFTVTTKFGAGVECFDLCMPCHHQVLFFGMALCCPVCKIQG